MLGENIRRLRQAKGINQVKLAKDLNVSKQAISNWENDEKLPSVDMLLRIADYFSVSTDSLLDLDYKRYLEVTDLTDEEMAHIQFIINAIAKKGKK